MVFWPEYLVTFEHISSVNFNIVLNAYNPTETDQLLNKCKPEEFTNSVTKQMLERHPVARNCVCIYVHTNIYTKYPVFNVSRNNMLDNG